MNPEEILAELEELSVKTEIKKSEIMDILKKYASIISVYDLMMATEYIRKDGEFIQAGYREKYFIYKIFPYAHEGSSGKRRLRQNSYY